MSTGSARLWSAQRPETLVVACSDGRLQGTIDHFLQTELGVQDYDRLFVPGGSGGLVAGGCEFLRADHARRELLFLLKAHRTREVILMAHAATDDGPPEAVCAHYRRLMPMDPVARIREQQAADIRELLASMQTDLVNIRVRAFRAEVDADLQVHYVPMV
jgi:hypothetical protein